MAHVQAVSLSCTHSMSPVLQLLAWLGVQGDAHLGVTVQHRSRVAQAPTQPSLRQLHLIHGELHDELRARGFPVGPGVIGENVTTRGLGLLALPRRTLLHLGAEVVAEVTGPRNPCTQFGGLRPGLMAAVLGRDEHGQLVRRAGIMAVVMVGGELRPSDSVVTVSGWSCPPPPHLPLERV